MPRFVILEHDWPHLHWDLMLEVGVALRTWRLQSPPQPDAVADAEHLGDHRIDYLDYEGPVSGDRGVVKRWDAGVYEEIAADVFRLVGERTNGTIRLRYVDGRWRCYFDSAFPDTGTIGTD